MLPLPGDIHVIFLWSAESVIPCPSVSGFQNIIDFWWYPLSSSAFSPEFFSFWVYAFAVVLVSFQKEQRNICINWKSILICLLVCDLSSPLEYKSQEVRGLVLFPAVCFLSKMLPGIPQMLNKYLLNEYMHEWMTCNVDLFEQCLYPAKK